MEKVLCEARFKLNKIAIILASVAGVLLLFTMTIGYAQWETIPYRLKTGFFNGFMWDMFIKVNFNRYFVWFVLFWLAVILFVYSFIITLKMNRCTMIVSNTRVTGKTSFGRQVDLPVTKISAVGLGSFDRIAVSTSAGSINFWLVDNRDEIYNILNSLLGTIQEDTRPIATANEAEQILKFKDLLDKGIITQEEFEAKKKQLLGL